MSQENFFQKRRPLDERRRISIRVDDVLPRGTAITRSTTDPGKGVAAVGDVLGFMIDPTVEGGPTAEQRGQLWGKELSLPDVAGDAVTLDPPYDAYECEGPQYVCLSGTGAIDNTTALGTKCSYNDGVLRVAQPSDTPRYRISDNSGLSGSELKADGDGPRLYLEIIN
jgi:hypothetical protein